MDGAYSIAGMIKRLFRKVLEEFRVRRAVRRILRECRGDWSRMESIGWWRRHRDKVDKAFMGTGSPRLLAQLKTVRGRWMDEVLEK